ncbi:hypothetical protein GCM10011369_08870 [Neiella marina]|uniref:Periplasmic binding protein domain-containing protein n=1 Tax=Neiella marina TaxID=508461 RepID=A0A8J2U315_9GAMM|nr:substrate-binding domain-containing protein [Neiella marina]GGA69428.1 hypothetical protein GCM10011369_08870 [Neiella marina]
MPSSTISAFIAVLALLSSEEKTPDCVGLVTASGGSQFWQEITAGARDAATELELTLEIRSSSYESNIEQQRQALKELESLGCIAMVVAPNTPKRAQDVAKLKQKGIETIFIDRDFAAERATAILTDNYATGERAAIAMADELPKGAQIGMIRLHQSIDSTSEREQGFIDAAKMVGLTVVFDEYIETGQDASSQQMAELLARHPQLAGLFTPNESTTTTAVLARQSLQRQHPMIHIGVDANKVLLSSLAQNQLHSLFLQRPYLIGYQGVMAAAKIADGHQLPDVILTESTYITAVDLEQPEIQALLQESDNRARQSDDATLPPSD